MIGRSLSHCAGLCGCGPRGRIDRSSNIRAALKKRQRGFFLNPFRFGGGESTADLSVVRAGFAGYATDTLRSFSPGTVADDDTAFVILMARDTVTPPSGFTLVDSVTNSADGTVVQTLYLYRKVLSASESSSTFTFTQATSQRIGLAYLIVRNSDGTPSIALDSATDNSFTSSSTPGNHPVPTVEASRSGLLFIVASSCTRGTTGAYAVPAGFTEATPTTLTGDDRMAVGYKVTTGVDSTSGLTCSHNISAHWGTELAAVIGPAP